MDVARYFNRSVADIENRARHGRQQILRRAQVIFADAHQGTSHLSLTITANLKDLTGSANAGYAVFTLRGYGANVPRVSGAIISQVSLLA